MSPEENSAKEPEKKKSGPDEQETNYTDLYTQINEQIGSEKERELLYKNVVEFAKISYELEERREKSLLHQSGQMLAAVSIVSAGLLYVLPVLLDHTSFSKSCILNLASIVFFLLLLGLGLALLAQWRFDYRVMINGARFLEEILNAKKIVKNQYEKQHNFDQQLIEQLDRMRESKKKNNNRRCKWIKYSMVFNLIAIIVILFFAGSAIPSSVVSAIPHFNLIVIAVVVILFFVGSIVPSFNLIAIIVILFFVFSAILSLTEKNTPKTADQFSKTEKTLPNVENNSFEKIKMIPKTEENREQTEVSTSHNGEVGTTSVPPDSLQIRDKEEQIEESGELTEVPTSHVGEVGTDSVPSDSLQIRDKKEITLPREADKENGF